MSFSISLLLYQNSPVSDTERLITPMRKAWRKFQKLGCCSRNSFSILITLPIPHVYHHSNLLPFYPGPPAYLANFKFTSVAVSCCCHLSLVPTERFLLGLEAFAFCPRNKNCLHPPFFQEKNKILPCGFFSSSHFCMMFYTITALDQSIQGKYFFSTISMSMINVKNILITK